MMSASNYSGPVFYVTNTESQGIDTYDDENGWSVSYPEGSLSWALEQAAACSREETPTIVLTSAVSGQTLIHGSIYNDEDGLAVHPCYILSHLNIVSEGSSPVTIKAATCEEGCCQAAIWVTGDVNIGKGIKLDTGLTLEGDITLDHTEVSGMLDLSEQSVIHGEGINFSGNSPICVSLVGWDGSASALQAAVKKALPAQTDYKLSASSPIIALNVTMITRDITIDEAWISSIVPKGFSDITLQSLDITGGQTLRVTAGTTLNIATEADTYSGSSLYISGNSTLIVEPGAKLVNQGGSYLSIHNNGGRLEMDGTDLTNTYIECNGEVTLTNCRGSGELLLLGEANKISITGCDLSQMEIGMDIFDWTTPIDLSGNYWGTTDLAEIKNKIVYWGGPNEGWPIHYSYFNKGLIIVDNPLATAPALRDDDTTPPALSLNRPTLTKAGEKLVQARLSWKGEAGATYTVKVNGETRYEGTASQVTLILPDGEHSYSVTATDAAGNTTTCSDSFSFDGAMPDILLWPPHITNAKNGKAKVTLSWEPYKKGASYTVMLDGEEVWSGTRTNCKLTLEDGEHYYRIIAEDKDGNIGRSSEVTFAFDATAPVVTLEAPSFTQNPQEITLHWQGEAGSSYKLTVNGKLVYSGTETSYTLTPAGGKSSYSYSIVATDAAGNVSKPLKGNFTANAQDKVAPEVELQPVQLKKAGDGLVRATIKWKGERGATYTLFIDDAPVYSGTSTSQTLVLPDGEHSYSLLAIDKAGNAATPIHGSFSCDTAAPVITGLESSVSKYGPNMSKASLSWECAELEGVSYTIKVGSTTYTNAQVTRQGNTLSFDHQGILKDGKHKYSITATDAAGNAMTYKGSFTTDTKAPTVKLGKITNTPAINGYAQTELQWKGEKGATYTLFVDGVEVYRGTDTRYCVSTLDGEHRYSVVATDAAYNSSMPAEGIFIADATGPAFAISNLELIRATYDKATVWLEWVGNEVQGITYSVLVDGKKVYQGAKERCKLSVKSGIHRYDIVATDKAGNSTLLSNTLEYSIRYGQGTVDWLPGMGQSVLERAPEIQWRGQETDGFTGTVDSTTPVNYYEFHISGESDVHIRLDVDSAPVNVSLLHGAGMNMGAASVTQGVSLDQQLTLSAGSYYLEIASSSGCATDYTLDIEYTDWLGTHQGVLVPLN